MDELEKLRKHWEDDDFQRKHALAREIVVNRLRELNREYEEKTGQGFVRFIETRMKTPESIAEKLQRKDYDVDFDTAVTALNDISGVRCICYSVKEIYWIARQIGKTDTYTVVKAKDYIRKPKKNELPYRSGYPDVLQRKDNCGSCGIAAADDDYGCVGRNG